MAPTMAKLIMSFFKQGNAKALRFLARQLKMQPKAMMNKANAISRSGNPMKGRRANTSKEIDEAAWRQYMDDYDAGMP